MKFLNNYKEEDLNKDLVAALFNIERICQQELIITSGKRVKSLAHKTGRGVDIRCADSGLRYRILDAAFSEGFLRIGIYDRHIHLDLECEGFPQCKVWWGKSK